MPQKPFVLCSKNHTTCLKRAIKIIQMLVIKHRESPKQTVIKALLFFQAHKRHHKITMMNTGVKRFAA